MTKAMVRKLFVVFLLIGLVLTAWLGMGKLTKLELLIIGGAAGLLHLLVNKLTEPK